jgi:hypothetical protein
MDIVREKAEFYYRKGITGDVSARWNGGTTCGRGKEGF